MRCLIVAIGILAMLAAGCGRSSGSATPGPSPLPSKATLVDGQTFVAVRTLSSSALSSEQLEAAGTAVAPGGARIEMARASSPEVQDWELVSAAPDGWRVWQPQVVLDAVAAAGDGASLVSVERAQWPDSCLGLAQAGEVCAQVVTSGYRVIVRLGSKQLEYHTDTDSFSGRARLAGEP
jgi:hypothetical protein